MAKIANAKYYENEDFAVLRTLSSGAKEFGEGNHNSIFIRVCGGDWQ